jgi:hypothetical protein
MLNNTIAATTPAKKLRIKTSLAIAQISDIRVLLVCPFSRMPQNLSSGRVRATCWLIRAIANKNRPASRQIHGHVVDRMLPRLGTRLPCATGATAHATNWPFSGT